MDISNSILKKPIFLFLFFDEIWTPFLALTCALIYGGIFLVNQLLLSFPNLFLCGIWKPDKMLQNLFCLLFCLYILANLWDQKNIVLMDEAKLVFLYHTWKFKNIYFFKYYFNQSTCYSNICHYSVFKISLKAMLDGQLDTVHPLKPSHRF